MNNENCIGIYLNLKDARKKSNLTQNGMAKKLGVSLNTLFNYENGITQPPAEIIQKYHQITGLSYDFLLDGLDVNDLELYRLLRRLPPCIRNDLLTLLRDIFKVK